MENYWWILGAWTVMSFTHCICCFWAEIKELLSIVLGNLHFGVAVIHQVRQCTRLGISSETSIEFSPPLVFSLVCLISIKQVSLKEFFCFYAWFIFMKQLFHKHLLFCIFERIILLLCMVLHGSSLWNNCFTCYIIYIKPFALLYYYIHLGSNVFTTLPPLVHLVAFSGYQ